MKRKFREVELTYYNPAVLTQTMEEAGSDLSWVEMIENIELGYKEFKSLMSLSEKADLSIREIICLFLYYWEEMPEQEIGTTMSIPQKTISNILIRAKGKLHPQLLKTMAKNA